MTLLSYRGLQEFSYLLGFNKQPRLEDDDFDEESLADHLQLLQARPEGDC